MPVIRVTVEFAVHIPDSDADNAEGIVDEMCRAALSETDQVSGYSIVESEVVK